MENLMFSLNATMPIFILIILGFFFRKIGLLKETMLNGLNQFVFKVTLPVLLFGDLAKQNFVDSWNGKFVAFCFFVTILSITLAACISMTLRNKNQKGEFIQGAYRSSAAILGIAFITNIYGDSGMAPLMIIASVPLYNIMAVMILSFTNPERTSIDGKLMKKTVKEILTNPIIIGILCGAIWSFFQFPSSTILDKTISNLGSLTTPLGLMSMGAAFDWNKAKTGMSSSFLASFIKLFGLCAVFLPSAILIGFREAELIAILVMLGSSTTVSCYVMAKNMGHDGVLTSSIIALTTCGSAFSLTFWLYILRTFKLI